MKRTVPLLITAAVGFILVANYFVPRLGGLEELANIHFNILAAIAFLLGGGNLLRSHGEKIYRQQAGWGYSAVAVFFFLLTLVVGLGKVGVTPPNNYWTGRSLAGDDGSFALARLDIRPAKRELTVQVRNYSADRVPVRIGSVAIGEVPLTNGDGGLVLQYDPGKPGDQPGAVLAGLVGTEEVQVGELRATMERFSSITGEFNADGSAFWFLFHYGFQPLQQTMFAMLAFYVASAAFRAFRARNVESVLLLGTAFIILLGRTFVGTFLTQELPDEGFWSFFQIPNLTAWIMSVFNTAGNRAIAIGIALGIASTSLKVLLGIDRSYLGSDRG